MKTSLLVGALTLATTLFAQNVVPAGTILPLTLNSSLNSKKSKSGQVVTARLMQDVSLRSGAKIRAGSKVIGRVLEVVDGSNGSGARLSLQFDTLEVSKREMPITTNLRALASMMDVWQAQIPKTGPDRGTSEDSWVTEQIGGDAVYGRGGPVTEGLHVVAVSTTTGALGRVVSKPGTKCGGDVSDNHSPQALWLFSADACGIYGFTDLTIVHAGRNTPVGQITLASEKRNFEVRRGSGLLLRVK